MKTIIGLVCVFCLCACTSIAAQTPQVTFVQACGAYNMAFQTALQLRIAGKLSPSQIDKITQIDTVVTPICTGPLPTNNVDLINQILTQTAALAIASK